MMLFFRAKITVLVEPIDDGLAGLSNRWVRFNQGPLLEKLIAHSKHCYRGEAMLAHRIELRITIAVHAAATAAATEARSWSNSVSRDIVRTLNRPRRCWIRCWKVSRARAFSGFADLGCVLQDRIG